MIDEKTEYARSLILISIKLQIAQIEEVIKAEKEKDKIKIFKEVLNAIKAIGKQIEEIKENQLLLSYMLAMALPILRGPIDIHKTLIMLSIKLDCDIDTVENKDECLINDDVFNSLKNIQ